jgi:hypothetical protein
MRLRAPAGVGCSDLLLGRSNDDANKERCGIDDSKHIGEYAPFVMVDCKGLPRQSKPEQADHSDDGKETRLSLVPVEMSLECKKGQENKREEKPRNQVRLGAQRRCLHAALVKRPRSLAAGR